MVKKGCRRKATGASAFCSASAVCGGGGICCFSEKHGRRFSSSAFTSRGWDAVTGSGFFTGKYICTFCRRHGGRLARSGPRGDGAHGRAAQSTPAPASAQGGYLPAKQADDPPEGFSLETYGCPTSRFYSPVQGTLTSGYGYRDNPVNGQEDFHAGLDIARRGRYACALCSGRAGGAGRLQPDTRQLHYGAPCKRGTNAVPASFLRVCACG